MDYVRIRLVEGFAGLCDDRKSWPAFRCGALEVSHDAF
jgi:hypothetical protein